MNPNIKSISSNQANNVRQDVFPFGQWTITTRKGIILQSKCTCQEEEKNRQLADKVDASERLSESSLPCCQICKYHQSLPQLNNMPDMLFKDNLLKLEHYTGLGIEFNALDALKLVEETKDPLQVAVAGGWQSARADFPFAKSIVKPYDWTLTTNYRGTLIAAIKRRQQQSKAKLTNQSSPDEKNFAISCNDGNKSPAEQEDNQTEDKLCFQVEETNERIDVSKLKVREEILFYDDITLYEDELADHGTAQYSVKVRVMPKSLFILARFYLRIDGVLARINDTRIYHELNRNYLLREYTNREAKLSSLNNLPVSTLVNPNELMNHLPIVESCYEKLVLPKLR